VEEKNKLNEKAGKKEEDVVEIFASETKLKTRKKASLESKSSTKKTPRKLLKQKILEMILQRYVFQKHNITFLVFFFCFSINYFR
jgi:hypothetical protein